MAFFVFDFKGLAIFVVGDVRKNVGDVRKFVGQVRKKVADVRFRPVGLRQS